MISPHSTLSLITTWVVEAALKLDNRSKLFQLLGNRCPQFWQRINKHKIWYLSLLTLDNIIVHSNKAYEIFSDEYFLSSFTHLLEEIFRLNPFIFCGADQERIRSEGRTLLKSLRCILAVAEQRRQLARGTLIYLPHKDELSHRVDHASKEVEEKLKEKSQFFWNTVVDSSEEAFSHFVGSVLDPQTLGVLKYISKVIQGNIIMGRTRLEAFFERGWEDYVHSEDKIFQGLVDIRKKYMEYNGINDAIIIDIIYLLYTHERKDILVPSRLPLLNKNNEIYVVETS
ncbi:unnamed protein product [Lepeophtheirus salmonis]|uniref:(salmon louse) hypothetical protein n=1 Tax=Lepeophtheirus salmonis TaxID=72036 RepID=A0A0K2UVH7_LEPSM|nr:unnamed protein product [Lepeophtheirus salmonis]CAF2917928.1 unnamed protein product [Lepeophtheirus salmonis]